MNLRRTIALGVVSALALAACGGDDASSDDASSDDSAVATTTVPAPDADEPSTDDTTEPSADEPSTDDTTAPDDGVVPTIAPDVPEEVLEGVGPIAVIGDALPPLPESGDDPAIGLVAPVIVAETLDGEPIRVDATVDGPTWIVFLAHWCPHCNDEIPVINELRDAGRIPEGVNVVGVSTAYNPERPNWPPGEWLGAMDWTFPAILDGLDMTSEIPYIALEAFGVTGYPFSVVLDGDGRVVARWSGGRTPDALVALAELGLG